jgi:hypothetical protein
LKNSLVLKTSKIEVKIGVIVYPMITPNTPAPSKTKIIATVILIIMEKIEIRNNFLVFREAMTM